MDNMNEHNGLQNFKGGSSAMEFKTFRIYFFLFQVDQNNNVSVIFVLPKRFIFIQ